MTSHKSCNNKNNDYATKGKSEKQSAEGAFRVKDKIRLSFQSELIAIEHEGVEILLIGSQGDYRQVFKEVPDFKKMVGG